MKTIEDFRRYYESELRPVLKGFEARRKKVLTNLWVTLTVIGMLAAAGMGVAWSVSKGELNEFVVVAGVLGLVAGVGAWWYLTRGFVKDFKNEVIRDVVRFCDPSLDYWPKEFIPQGRFQAGDIFQERIDRYRGEDYVTGKVDKTAFAFSELHAEYKTTSRDRKGRRQTHWHTIFKGLYFIGDFNKEFKTKTVVLPDVAERFFGFLGQKLQGMNVSRWGELVKLEDPEFEKHFVVYGKDQVEARYLLSMSLMRRIMDFKEKTGHDICLSFVHSNVHVAIKGSKNIFEPRIFRSVLDFDLIREYVEDLELATGLIEDLNLNTRIWTKQ